MSDIKDDAILMKQLGDSLLAAPNGMCKEASEAASKFTRRKLREDAFSPAILPYEDISRTDLSQFLDREDPGIICEMEPDSPGAKTMSFNDTADNTSYKGNKYLLVFHVNTTPEFIKNVNYLMGYRMDLREIIVDNSLRDLSRQKDFYWMKLTNSIVGTTPGAISPETGLEQNVVYAGRMTKDNMINAKLLLADRDLLPSIFLTNNRTFNEICRWDRNTLGGDFVQELSKEGTGAFQKAHWMGVDFIVTLKHDLVPNGTLFEYVSPNFLGRAGVLHKPTMYVEKKKDILRFSCRETVGVTIANTAGVQKVTFAGVTGNYGGDGRLSLIGGTGPDKAKYGTKPDAGVDIDVKPA